MIRCWPIGWPSMDNELGEEQSRQLQNRDTSVRLDRSQHRLRAASSRRSPAPPAPPLSFGMAFRGAGYRQTDYQTVWRGTGDSLQRAGVFTQLCRQASIPAFVLATESIGLKRGAELDPWCVGVLIGDEIYLFEPELGTFVPGPDQVGVATLSQARSDASGAAATERARLL